MTDDMSTAIDILDIEDQPDFLQSLPEEVRVMMARTRALEA